MQYSSRIKQKTLEELSPDRKKQIEVAELLYDMTKNHGGWKIYENWLSDQYEEAFAKLKTCKPEELLEYQTAIKYIESIKGWLTNTIERGIKLKTILVSETKEGK